MLTAVPRRIAVLCSHRAPGLLHLLTEAPGRGRTWQVVCCLTTEESFAEEAQVQARHVPVVYHPVRAFYAAHAPDARLGDLGVREAYDRRTLDLLQPYAPEFIILAGYLLLLTAPMLTAYARRIINVHHSDLLLRDANGSPRYPGLHAVRDAILAGERETRSTSHVVSACLDDGPLLLRSEAFPVPEVAAWARAAGADDVLRKVIWTQQEWMLRTVFGPLMEQSIDLLVQLQQPGHAPAEVRT